MIEPIGIHALSNDNKTKALEAVYCLSDSLPKTDHERRNAPIIDLVPLSLDVNCQDCS